MKKLLLLLLCVPLMFSSCQKCKECEPSGDDQAIIGYNEVIVGYNSGGFTIDDQGNFVSCPATPVYENQPIYAPVQFEEVCRDNFSSKTDFNEYINALEDAGYICKSDFWN